MVAEGQPSTPWPHLSSGASPPFLHAPAPPAGSSAALRFDPTRFPVYPVTRHVAALKVLFGNIKWIRSKEVRSPRFRCGS